MLATNRFAVSTLSRLGTFDGSTTFSLASTRWRRAFISDIVAREDETAHEV